MGVTEILFILDTSFMYMIGILSWIHLYQSRQPYLGVKAHFAYLGFASLISMAILGVVSITANYKLL